MPDTITRRRPTTRSAIYFETDDNNHVDRDDSDHNRGDQGDREVSR